MSEELITLRQAPALLPGNPHWRTLRRWARAGLCDGRVKLRLTRVGGRYFVSAADLREFQDAVNAIVDAPKQTLESPRARRREVDAAFRRCGIDPSTVPG